MEKKCCNCKFYLSGYPFTSREGEIIEQGYCNWGARKLNIPFWAYAGQVKAEQGKTCHEFNPK